MNAIDEAIEKAGGVVALATALGLERYQTVQSWQRTGSAPAHVCPAIERATGVSRWRLNRRGSRIWPELIDADHPIPTSTEQVTV